MAERSLCKITIGYLNYWQTEIPELNPVRSSFTHYYQTGKDTDVTFKVLDASNVLAIKYIYGRLYFPWFSKM